MSIVIKKDVIVTSENSSALCLTKVDIKSVKDVAAELVEMDSDRDILSCARRILNQTKRNIKAKGNQKNIDVIKRLIKEQTESGDYISPSSCWELLRDRNINSEFAQWTAILMALMQLRDEGYLENKIIEVREYGKKVTKKCYLVK
jgi:hypothetical protein